MKKFLSILLILCMLSAALVACDSGNTPSDTDPVTDPVDSDPVSDTPVTPDPENALYVGYGRECISPTEQDYQYWSLAGYYDGRPIEGIRDDIYVSCTAFRDHTGTTALIYTLDLHAISPAQATEIANAITKATKVPKSHIALNVTHNHAAPSLSYDGADKLHYKDIIFNGIVNSALEAIDDLALCTELYAGEISFKGFNFTRRYLTENGNLYGVGAGGDETIVAYENEVDYMIPVAKFVRQGALPVILANFAAHCDTVSGDDPGLVSADFVSTFRRTVENKLSCHFSMQLGATGDVNPKSRMPDYKGFDGTTQYGRSLAFNLIEKIDNLEKLEINANIEAKSSNVRVAFNHATDYLLDKAVEVKSIYDGDKKNNIEPDHETAEALMKEYGFASIYEVMYIVGRANKGEYERRNVSVISIGNIAFACADFEMFSQTGRNIKDAGNELFDLTFMCAYTNGMIGYIPAAYAFDNGGYEVYSCYYEKGSAEIIEAKIFEILKEVAAK